VSEIKDSQRGYFCDECNASFFTQEGLETHSQRQHGVCCETCPIDSFVEKVANLFRHK